MTWFIRNWEQVAVALWQHIVISATSLAIAFAISLVVGIWAARHDRVLRWALAVSGILYTIPTLAFLALLIPVVGLGRTNAIICMVAFADDPGATSASAGSRRGRRGGEGHGHGQRRDNADRAAARARDVAGLRIATVTVIMSVAARVGAGGARDADSVGSSTSAEDLDGR
jgi:osmoprotectant transport system permease protein